MEPLSLNQVCLAGAHCELPICGTEEQLPGSQGAAFSQQLFCDKCDLPLHMAVSGVSCSLPLEDGSLSQGTRGRIGRAGRNHHRGCSHDLAWSHRTRHHGACDRNLHPAACSSHRSCHGHESGPARYKTHTLALADICFVGACCGQAEQPMEAALLSCG